MCLLPGIRGAMFGKKAVPSPGFPQLRESKGVWNIVCVRIGVSSRFTCADAVIPVARYLNIYKKILTKSVIIQNVKWWLLIIFYTFPSVLPQNNSGVCYDRLDRSSQLGLRKKGGVSNPVLYGRKAFSVTAARVLSAFGGSEKKYIIWNGVFN